MQLSDRTRTVITALALAVAAALIIVLAVKKSGGGSPTTKTSGENVSVLVAIHDIPASTPGSELTGKVRPAQVPREDVVQGAISKVEQVASLVSTATIYSGEQITVRRFQPQTVEGVSGEIEGNFRAVQIPGDANQLLVGTLHQGDHVDLVANIKFQLGNFRLKGDVSQALAQANLVASRIVLRNIAVLRDPARPSGSGGLGGGGGYQTLLAVTDSQAQKLFFVLKNGDWTLQLRPAHGATDSPEGVETTGSVLVDGLRLPQFQQLLLGPNEPTR